MKAHEQEQLEQARRDWSRGSYRFRAEAQRDTRVILTLWGFGAVMVLAGAGLLGGVAAALLAAGLLLMALGGVLLVI